MHTLIIAAVELIERLDPARPTVSACPWAASSAGGSPL
jgi:hypothetical protein